MITKNYQDDFPELG